MAESDRQIEIDFNIENLLNRSDVSVLISRRGRYPAIAVGVPHHAPSGVFHLMTSPPRPSDENTGHLGLLLSQILDSSLIIASNYHFDVNKTLESDYTRTLQSLSPKLLVELHGHNNRKSHFDIEISCGSAADSRLSQEFSLALANACLDHNSLKNYSISGDFNKIYFQATQSITISSMPWTSFHIELPPSLRYKPGKTAIPQSGVEFCWILAGVISAFHSRLTEKKYV